MMQQINLYQDQFRQKRQPLSSVAILLILLLSCVALTALQYVNKMGVPPLRAELDGLNQEQADLVAKIAVAERAAKPKPVDKILLKKVQQLDSRLQFSKKLLAALTDTAKTNTRGFSLYFDAIANQHITGTWITNISISNGGHQFGFSGKAITPELIPDYIQNLSDADAFNNYSFNIFEMKRSEKEPAVIDFNVATGKG